MEWINEIKTNEPEIDPAANCVINWCWDRKTEPCPELNGCFSKHCLNKGCWSYS